MADKGADAAVPDVFEPPPGNPRFPYFDGLRAAAAVGVLLGHCAGASGIAATSGVGHVIGNLQMGVTVFFVISGFLLYRPFVAGDMAGRGHPKTVTFYRRRVLRIFPAYWFALLAVSLLPGVISVFGPGWWRYFLLVQNYSGFEFTFARGIGPAWSLSVELAFYALLPIAALVLRMLGGSDPARRLKGDLLVLAMVAILSAGSRYWFTSQIVSDGFFADPFHLTAILTLPLYATWFAIGMAFASLSAWRHNSGSNPSWLAALERRPGLVWLAATAAFLALTATTPVLTQGEFPAHHLMTGLVAGLLVFPAAFPAAGGSGLPGRLLSLRPVAWVGLVSYGIYLWSTPILQALVSEGVLDARFPFVTVTVSVLILAIAAGAFSYYVVERPFLRRKEPRRRPPAVAAG